MTALTRRRTAAIVALVAGALSPLVAVHWARTRAARALATHDATAVAGYLPLVTPPARGSADYDLPQLLIRAHALDELPGLSAQFEIYHRTAPLMQATATPLPAAVLEGLRRETWVHWIGDRGAALAPLLDRDGWEVVGVVAAYPDVGGWPVSPWLLAALLLLVVAGGQAIRAIGSGPEARRQAQKQYWAAAALFGVAAFADLRLVTSGATDRWLSDVRLLMQEAAARAPEARSAPTLLAVIARGAETVPADSERAGVWRRRSDGITRASVAVRLAPGRWLEVRAEPGEAGTAGWLLVMLGVAALGPLATGLASWSVGAPRRRRETLAAWGFLTPSMLHLAAFSFLPLLFALYLSVHRWSPIEPAHPFVGLANYERVLADPLVWAALGHTVLYAGTVPLSLVVALAVALLLARAGGWALRALLVPHAVSVVAIGLIWRSLYNPDVGLINEWLTRAGAAPGNWLGDPKTALVALMAVSVWMQLGYQVTVLTLGLRAIPAAYLEAARLDGAGHWQRFRRVTLPLLRPALLFGLVTGLVGAFQVFALVIATTGGGPLHATDVIVSRIYRTAWEALRFGEASAMALLLFALLFGLTWVQLKLLDGQVEHG
ncbi:MAG TPA: sugar ABC transporter permease [Gemmatimonadales bacterium]|nr:sugar ABC transporter permease [Gemmatimonadales bacterium]